MSAYRVPLRLLLSFSRLDLVLDHVKSSTDNAYHGDIKSLLNGVQDEVVGRYEQYSIPVLPF